MYSNCGDHDTSLVRCDLFRVKCYLLVVLVEEIRKPDITDKEGKGVVKITQQKSLFIEIIYNALVKVTVYSTP